MKSEKPTNKKKTATKKIAPSEYAMQLAERLTLAAIPRMGEDSILDFFEEAVARITNLVQL